MRVGMLSSSWWMACSAWIFHVLECAAQWSMASTPIIRAIIRFSTRGLHCNLEPWGLLLMWRGQWLGNHLRGHPMMSSKPSAQWKKCAHFGIWYAVVYGFTFLLYIANKGGNSMLPWDSKHWGNLQRWKKMVLFKLKSIVITFSS